MAKGKQKIEEESILNIAPLNTGVASFCVLGTAPLIQNRMAEKARMELLFPRGRLTASDKVFKVKHNPLEEYRSAAYAPKDKQYETRIIHPARAFRKAMAEAALETPGAQKAQTIRLTWIVAEFGNVPIYGIPQLYMATVRMADQKKTPDIRTRAIYPNWGCILNVRFVRPKLTATTIGNLLAWAGMLIGIGDDRHEKIGDYGMFELVSADDPRFVELQKNGGREAQDKALQKPEFFDADTEELFNGWGAEYLRRERQAAEKDEKKRVPIPAGRNTRKNQPAEVEA